MDCHRADAGQSTLKVHIEDGNIWNPGQRREACKPVILLPSKKMFNNYCTCACDVFWMQLGARGGRHPALYVHIDIIHVRILNVRTARRAYVQQIHLYYVCIANICVWLRAYKYTRIFVVCLGYFYMGYARAFTTIVRPARRSANPAQATMLSAAANTNTKQQEHNQRKSNRQIVLD